MTVSLDNSALGLPEARPVKQLVAAKWAELNMADRVGFQPTTSRLVVGSSMR